jgi:hypothetical protein
MQTFVISEDPVQCSWQLDRQRLGKQRVECLQILRALRGITRGWRNHPATRMWEGHENALCDYGVLMCDEWIRRGFEDSCREKILAFRESGAPAPLPNWWGGPIHASHRASLLHRMPGWYSQFGWGESPSDDELFWPVPLLSGGKSRA